MGKNKDFDYMSSLKCPESGEKIKKMKVISLILSLLIVIGSMTLLSGCANLTSNRTEIVIISDIWKLNG